MSDALNLNPAKLKSRVEKCTHLEDEVIGQQLRDTTLVWPMEMGLDREGIVMMRWGT